jgi:hypothetical protein
MGHERTQNRTNVIRVVGLSFVVDCNREQAFGATEELAQSLLARLTRWASMKPVPHARVRGGAASPLAKVCRGIFMALDLRAPAAPKPLEQAC